VFQIANARASYFELNVMPWRTGPVPLGDVDRLDVAHMFAGVVAPMAQVNAPHVGHIAIAAISVPHNHQLLMVTAASPHALVKQNLATGLIDRLRERHVVLFREMSLTWV
jgi:hypothetical protein